MENDTQGLCPNGRFSPDLSKPVNHCEFCDKSVTNLSQMTKEEADKWRAQNPNGCVTVVTDHRKKAIYRQKLLSYLMAGAVITASAQGYATIAAVAVSSDDWIGQYWELVGDRMEALGLKSEPVVQKFNGGNPAVTSEVVF